ncbi:FecR domain-containing protein [Methylobacillus gramineus]|uniref:FecR domain-containing protein n=1 Tax=Methylobacillus gramineus TaxID=755169 RepID=UPI001CFFC17F|nr:FecR domain-containing protein [Methylobacillus gramineus]MCB5185475.1 FecR domain-containing protein [Methylobacillus gramineus]
MTVPMQEEVALQAAEWFFRLQEPNATEGERQACGAWREADPVHEAAWQRALEVSAKLGVLPGGLAYATLKRTQQQSRRHAIKTLALLISTGVVGWQGWRSEPARLWRAEYSTSTGEHRQVRLADGTEVHLNTASGINTYLDANQRQILLEAGEILIQTAPDARPMLVESSHGRMQPLGTRFIVRQAAHHTQLAVLEGSVEITTLAGERGVIEAGWQTNFGSAGIAPVEPVTPHADSWTKGVLYAREMRLADFAAELGRYRHGVVRCAPEVYELRISGVFQINNTDAVIGSLPMMLPVQVSYLTRYWVMFSAPGTPAA